MPGRSRRDVGRFFLWFACAAGAVHAGFSLFWAAGGTWLLDTVGEGAVRLQHTHPLGTAALLGAVTALKAAGAALPVIVERKPRAPFRTLIRAAGWLGGCFLVVYGTAFAVMSSCVLNGVITPSGEIDRRGMIGHACLWDPLFAVWGATLVIGLSLTGRSVADRASVRG